MRKIVFIFIFMFAFSLNLFSNVSINGTINRNLRIVYLYSLNDIANFNTRLFTVTFTNDADTAATVHLLITLSSQRYGEITVMTTNEFTLNPLETWSLQNTSLNNNSKNVRVNNIQINSSIEGLISRTIAEGKLPEDVYHLSVSVLAPDNTVLSVWGDDFTVINSIVITPIFPGGGNLRDIETINSLNLSFIWNSRADMTYNFYLYKYSPGIVSGINVLSNPIYEKDDISKKMLEYPPDAPPLEKGEIYVWQVSGYIITSNGGKQVKSEPYFFKYVGAPEVDNTVLLDVIRRLIGRNALSDKSKIVEARLNGKKISLINLLYILNRLNKEQIKNVEVEK